MVRVCVYKTRREQETKGVRENRGKFIEYTWTWLMSKRKSRSSILDQFSNSIFSKLSLERILFHILLLFFMRNHVARVCPLLHRKYLHIIKLETRANVYQQVSYMGNRDSQFSNKNYCRCERSFKREMSGEAWRYKQAICILCEYYATTARFVRLLFTGEKRVYYAST